jgi:hypothetical protein
MRWLIVVLLLTGCAAAPVAAPGATPTPTPTPRHTYIGFQRELHDELVAMLERDQAGRLGGTDSEGDGARTERLREILDEYGWPTFELVGEDGEDAAWAIAQHSDLDQEFQKYALELLRDAVEVGQGSPGNLAYLEDRINVANGDNQNYGTQVGCGDDGPQPATPINDPETVDDRRVAAGLAPLADYLAEMVPICAEIE